MRGMAWAAAFAVATAWAQHPAEQSNMELVGYNDLQARSAYQPLVHRQGERFIAYIGHHGGKAMNPLTLEGQVRGAAVQGIAGALYEEFSYSEEGQPLSTSFMDYAMPTAAEVSDIDVLLLESGKHDEADPMAGAKGGGEGGIIATAATLSNAVADALGEPGGELLTLPITPERVRELAARRTSAGAVR